jgi:hypothetical protein
MIKSKHPFKFPLRSLLAGAAFIAVNNTASAQTFAYADCDLVAGFRQVGGAYDLVVNLGPVAALETLAPHAVVLMSGPDATQLADALPSLSGVSWSVSAAQHGGANDADYALQTIWATAPWVTPTTPGPVWKRQSVWTQGGVASQIDKIGSGAVTYGVGQPAGADNTTNGVLIPTSDQYSYSSSIGSDGDFGWTFQGCAENTTPENFETAGLPSRSVLYRLTPASGADNGTPGIVVGFFDFSANGSLTFTAGPPPQQTSIAYVERNAGIVTVWFPTVSGCRYRLRYSDVIDSPLASWSLGAAVEGDGTTLSLQDSNSGAARFYAIESY